ncbi:MAG: hypothetical protein R3B57_03880 [Phycisphaerales bacterium]
MARLVLEAGELSASIDPELGAGLADLSMNGPAGDATALVRRARDGVTEAGRMGMFLMAPWTNRVAGAAFASRGERHALRSDFPDGTAIHGDVRGREWRITDRTPLSARLVFDSREHERVNFPWAFGCVARYELMMTGLIVELSVTNLDETPMPTGAGVHPFFPRRLWADGDEVRLRAPVSGRYPSQGCIPTGEAVEDEASQALRAGGALGDPGLDDVFAGFGGEAVIEWPTSGVRLTMRCSESLDHLVVFTPRAKGGGPLTWFCVEPTSMVNDGFNLSERGMEGTGVRVLEAGETLETRVEIRVERV